ncbi:MAG TPA: peptidoglycan-binding protein [Candidatus Blautia avistercoris]|uniref:peptidoglycan-binding protein n=1 Tax=Blautia sp. An249 TaxID=1965603 RepID=UPI000B38392D|nr:peptidoglycan-binding protein [Blautia sp. An249]OUO78635.1 peptidoglycan-binding protein [Blautia sp. An249]HIY19364.1 peptidoglycan-binding protein [Candidatus Blautia avistercoris]
MKKGRNLKAMQTEQNEKGRLRIRVLREDRNTPVENALIRISYKGEPDKVIEEVRTDNSGRSPELELSAPPLAYSMEPVEYQPYSEYNVYVEASDFEPANISGVEILPQTDSVQPVRLRAIRGPEDFERIVIPDHTLYGEYPPKIPEDEIKPMQETGEIVLSRVVIPEYVVVHDGSVNDDTATDYYVRYRDYIKNVACSEIYATWPEETIKANVLAIMSFTLNRVYTEWYRNKGFDFTITSSTAYDHKWMRGRNIFDSIDRVVDELFSHYLSRPNVRQPILTQYCDGERVTCPNWMTQWGSKRLGDQGYSAIEILRHFYGNDMYINTAEEISGIPASWPRYDLDIGASGEKVRQIQEQLNAIKEAYPALPEVVENGEYNEETQQAVRDFQEIFGLPVTGIVDYNTWYKIQEIYVAVTRIAELS